MNIYILGVINSILILGVVFQLIKIWRYDG